MKHPIDKVTWVPVDTLNANDYNPNHVFGPEMKLLERSLIATGWVQPILTVSLEDPHIVDGFHRSLLAKSPAIFARDGGLVPIAPLGITRPEAIVVTVRMNRAKGSHAALLMSDLVRELIDDHGLPPAKVAEEMGMTLDEVALLHSTGIFKARKLEGRPYSRAWVPIESKERPA
jgi:hypothetical protein